MFHSEENEFPQRCEQGGSYRVTTMTHQEKGLPLVEINSNGMPNSGPYAYISDAPPC
jgi:hypothetical protein